MKNIRYYAFNIIDYLKGAKVNKNLEDIRKINLSADYSFILRESEKKLNYILEYAKNNVEFYKNINETSNIEDFPIVTKASILEKYDGFISKDYLNKANIHKACTSGSSGRAFCVYQSEEKRNRVNADLIFFGEVCGYNIGDKLIYSRSWTKSKAKSKAELIKKNVIPFNAGGIEPEDATSLAKSINSSKAKAILGYAKTLELYAKFLLKDKDHNAFDSLKVIISSSEVLTEDMKRTIEEAFGCPVVSRYSSEELGFCAQQDINCDKFKLNFASLYFEFLKLDSDEYAEPGECARIVITDLFNFAMPLIRYDTEDICYFNYDSDGIPYIEEVLGREHDFLYDVKGNRVQSYSITNQLAFMQEFTQYKITQTHDKTYEFIYVSDKDIDEKEIDTFLRNTLGDTAQIIIKEVNCIKPLKSGKYRPVECLYNKN